MFLAYQPKFNMSEQIKFPYELKNAFFVSLSFSRIREVPHPLELATAIEAGISETKFPTLQLDLKVKTEENAPASFSIHLVGLFEYQGEEKEYNHELEIEFALERGLPSLWPIISQTVKVITAQMGLSPLSLRNPVSFGSKDVMLQNWKIRKVSDGE